MRLRKKKNLDGRLEACSNILLDSNNGRNYYSMIGKHQYIDYSATFGNDNPVVLELGCGRGMYATTYATTHPDSNIIAVEKLSNVIVEACESTLPLNLSNIAYLNCGAEQLAYYIPPHSISAIYLNFSCPFPKATYANRRLTYLPMLELYRTLLVDGGTIVQKTDNDPFFAYSLEQYQLANMQIIEHTTDIYNSPYIEGNIATEYETKFHSLGKSINYAKIIVDGNI